MHIADLCPKTKKKKKKFKSGVVILCNFFFVRLNFCTEAYIYRGAESNFDRIDLSN